MPLADPPMPPPLSIRACVRAQRDRLHRRLPPLIIGLLLHFRVQCAFGQLHDAAPEGSLLGTITYLVRIMATSGDAEHVDLLEWSKELDQFLLQLPFRPLRSTRAVVLYKLAYSKTHSQLGLLVLDCDTCAAYYEGVSLRTLERRSHLGSSSSSSTTNADPDARLADLASALHDALDAASSNPQASVELETTRFSCSLAIQATATDVGIARQLKASFDLDPLNHAAHATLLSTHLVRPLLSLAAAIARAPTQDQLASIASDHNRAAQRMISASSLKLIQATSLAHAGKPSQVLQFGANGDDHDLAQDVDRSSYLSNPIKPESTKHNGLDGHRDMVFFGPPGFKPPRSPNDRVRRSSQANGHARDAPNSSDAESNDDDGDITLNATDIVRPTAAQQPRRQMSPSPSLAVAAASIHRIKTEPTDAASDSDTSEEEESLPVKRLNNAQPRTSPDPPKRTDEDSEVPPPATPSASAFAPTPSQTVSPTRDAARNEQLRRRQQIASIKRGHEDPVSAVSGPAAQPNTTRLGAKQPQASRKRSRF